jgi:UDP-GlcNAc:undecaprenyl-phosphate/decaprenyl-phosphate GlcNAc-1-phosphate transferase
MRSFLAAFLLAMCLAAVLTPAVRWLAFRVGAVATPGGRHVHGRATPRLGGIAIALATCAPLCALFIVDSGVARIIREESSLAAGLLIGGVALCSVGVIDDARGVRASYKLAAQVVAAGVAYGSGFRIEAIHVPLLGALPMGVFALPVTVLWIVGITNAVNLIDGLDGLAAGVVFLAAGTNFAVAWISTNVFVAVLMAAVMGSLLGFLFYNFNPARIFMGDSGSYFLGFVLATSSLAGASHKASTAVSLLVPIIALGLPIFDTLFSMVRRMLERRPLFSPDRGHIHHRLLDMGITHRRAVMILYGVSVALTVAAIGISVGRQWETGLALACATVVMVGLVRFVGYFEYLRVPRNQRDRLYDPHAERLRRCLPGFIQRLGVVQSDEAVWLEVASVARGADLAWFEVATVEANSNLELHHRWDAPDRKVRDLVAARFPVGQRGSARAVITFGWDSDTRLVTPHADILLQVIVDVIEQNLLRTASRLAPSLEHEREEQKRGSSASHSGLAPGPKARARTGFGTPSRESN